VDEGLAALVARPRRGELALRQLVPVQRFRGGLVFEAHRLLYHSTLGWRVIKQKKKALLPWWLAHAAQSSRSASLYLLKVW